MKPPAQAMERLRRIVGPKGWSTDAHENAPHLEDWRKLHHGATAMVLKPETSDEVRRIVACAAEYRLALVPQGGNTGLVGGSIPDRSGDQILVSLQRLRGIRALDPLNYTITVDAGVTLTQVQEAASGANRFFPLSIGSEGSAQIGGLISTNAGGVSVLKYGSMRDLVLGLEVILPSGEMWNGLNGLRKDNTGYDLKQLFIGAEGTLGIVTAATLKLFPDVKSRVTALAAVRDPGAAVKLLSIARELSGDSVASFELMPRIALDLVFNHLPACADPLARIHPWYVLMELTSTREGADLRTMLEDILAAGLDRDLIDDGTIAASDWQAQNLWRLRHSISEAERQEGVSIKHDVSVAVSDMPAFIAEATPLCETLVPGARVVAFGHIGDGNVHFNVQQPIGDDGRFKQHWATMNRIVHDLVMKYHGSISAEHGIGTLKRAELAHYKSQDVDIMRQIKTMLDPQNIMNPDKVV